jgi:hypothetical protein
MGNTITLINITIILHLEVIVIIQHKQIIWYIMFLSIMLQKILTIHKILIYQI